MINDPEVLKRNLERFVRQRLTNRIGQRKDCQVCFPKERTKLMTAITLDGGVFHHKRQPTVVRVYSKA
jgi:hypothetical protein